MKSAETSTISKSDLESVCNLVHVNIDAVESYDQALKHATSPAIKNKLSTFKANHQRHVEELTTLIKKLGGNPPKKEKDLKGFFIKGMTAIESILGESAALHAIKSNEKTVCRQYESALDLDLPHEAKQVIEKQVGDTKMHLEYLDQVTK